MWFISRNIIEYLANNEIPSSKRIYVINKNKNRIIKEIDKLEAIEIVDYLFGSKILNELKKIICEEVDKISDKYDASSKKKIEDIRKEFKSRGIAKEKYITSDVCPKVLKKDMIETIYGKKAYDVVKNGKVSKKVKKAIISLNLDRYQRNKLLNRDIQEELKEYIIDECLETNYDIGSALDNKNVPVRWKAIIIDRKININNLFSVLDNAEQSTCEFILEIKHKEFSDYLDTLNYRNVLNILNNFNTPKILIEYVLSHKRDVVELAIEKANTDTLTDLVYRERNPELVRIALEKRSKTIYGIIKLMPDYQLLRWLNIKSLPMEYKEFLINNRKRGLKNCIKDLSAYNADDYLRRDCNLPDEIQMRIFEEKGEKLFEYLGDKNDEDIISSIRFRRYIVPFKKILIERRINEGNIFKLLGDRYLDKETLDLTLELKRDLLGKILLSHNNDTVFKGKFVVLSDNVVDGLLYSNRHLINERLDKLNEDELLKYLNNKDVVGIVKKLILEKIGIDSVNVDNIYNLIRIYDTKLILDNYENIKDFISNLGIDFNSFLQYGSGSKKYNKWIDNILEIIFNDDIEDFTLCKNYLFNNYYDLKNENSVYLISSFLEYLNYYSKYKELFMNLAKDNIKLSKDDKANLSFLFKVSGVKKEEFPTSIYELNKFKLQLYKNYLNRINSNSISIYNLKEIFNNVIFGDVTKILDNIGGSGALRTLRKDNIDSPTIVELINELMLYSSIIEMVNDTNNEEGLKNVLIYIFSDINLLTKLQNMFFDFENRVIRLYELDSNNNLTTIEEARKLGLILEDKSKEYGGEVFDYSKSNYCLYGHILSSKENIEDVVNGVSTGKSNFISVSPVSYRGQKYYYDRTNVTIAYDRLPKGSFICSSVSNMGTNYAVSNNSSEVSNINRVQRGILETSAVIEQNAEALLYREGLKPCGLILPGGRTPSKTEMFIHEKYNLPFIITQPVHCAIDDPNYVFVNDLNVEYEEKNTEELEKIFNMLKPNVVINKEDDIYTGREIAVFTDCHSMYEPTLAILEDIRRRGIDEIYSLGDNVGIGPNPVEVFDLLDEYGVKSVAGNAEYYNTLGTEPFPYLAEARLDDKLWTERKLGQGRISELRLYPSSIDLNIGNRKFALCHFANDVRWDFRDRSVHSYYKNGVINSEQLRYTNSSDAIKKITNCVVSNKNSSIVKGYLDAKEHPIFGGKLVTDYDCILQGHYHFYLEDELDDTHVFTLRAVSMGYQDKEKENEACYYILKERKDGDVDMETVYVSFNRNSLLSSIHTCDLPSKDKVLSYVRKSR